MNKGKIAGMRPDAPIDKESKRDSDNLAKAITDALTQLRVCRDGSAIAHFSLTKAYATFGSANMQNPRINGGVA